MADVTDAGLRPVLDESVFLGLGNAVHDGAPLGATGRRELAMALAGYAVAARGLGATHVTLLGTEPLRRAPDAARIVGEVQREARAPLHVLSHEEEALLTLIGVTGGRPADRELLAIDIGGGSSEFAFVGPGRAAHAQGLRLGSARLTARHVSHDPPTAAEIEAMTGSARAMLDAARVVRPDVVVGVGGTASNLVKLLPEALADMTLTRDRLASIRITLETMPAADLTTRFLVNPVRARLLGAGAAIVDAILERSGVDAMRVSKASLREGAILAVDRAGPAWRDRLADLAHGWGT